MNGQPEWWMAISTEIMRSLLIMLRGTEAVKLKEHTSFVAIKL